MKTLPNKITQLNLHRRLVWVSILMGVGILAFLVFFYYSYSASLQLEKKAQTKHLTQVGVDVVKYYYGLASTGQMTSEEAKKSAIDTLKSVRYGGDGYYWVFNGNGTLLMQPYSPRLVGFDFKNSTDIRGKYFFHDFISTAKQGGGWVSYYWPKPNSKEQYPKVSYVVYFKPWDWVLGTGVYVDDVQRSAFWAVFDASWILIVIFAFFVSTSIFIANTLVKKIESIAIRDELTNLHTMRFLKEITPSILSKQQREKDLLLAAIFIDIDHFKNVNDNYGHDYGDKVLAQVAKVMMDITRPNDLCVRFGGEEFLFIGSFESKESIVLVAERIRAETAKLVFKHKDTDFSITLSAGIAIYQSGVESFDDMLRRADQKMYESKQGGRNRVSI